MSFDIARPVAEEVRRHLLKQTMCLRLLQLVEYDQTTFSGCQRFKKEK